MWIDCSAGRLRDRLTRSSQSFEQIRRLTGGIVLGEFRLDCFGPCGKGRLVQHCPHCTAHAIHGRTIRSQIQPDAAVGNAIADFDAYFHREWLRGLFAVAAARLRDDCAARGRPDRYPLFEAYDRANPGWRDTVLSFSFRTCRSS